MGLVIRSKDPQSMSKIVPSKKSNGIVPKFKLVSAVSTRGYIITSKEGISWTERTSGLTKYLVSVTYWNNKFVAAGYSGTILTSSDVIS